MSLRGQCRDIFVRRDAADIDAQTKRRPRVAGVKHVGVTLRLLGADAVDPPLRVGKPCLGLAGDGRQHVVPAPQKVAQHRIDQTLRGRALDPSGRAHRAVDDRVRRRLRVNELVEGNPEERLDTRVGERPLGEESHDGAHLTEKAQCAVRKLAHESAISNVLLIIACEHRGERRSREDPDAADDTQRPVVGQQPHLAIDHGRIEQLRQALDRRGALGRRTDAPPRPAGQRGQQQQAGQQPMTARGNLDGDGRRGRRPGQATDARRAASRRAAALTCRAPGAPIA